MIARLLVLSLFMGAVGCGGCESTSSTEVGVRTNLLGIFESRGHQEVYQPGGVYFMLPIVNNWATLPINQQNLTMNASPHEGDRPVPDDITFKTKDGNNVFIDVNLMWRIDPTKAGHVVTYIGQTIDEIKERLVRPISRATIRDVFNEITSEEYYQVTVKNRMAEVAKKRLAETLEPYGIIVDMLQVQQHRFDHAYQEAINAQKQAEADVQTLIEQQKNMVQQKQSELEGKRSEWNKMQEEANGEAGRVRNEADGYYETQSNEAKALIAKAQSQAMATKKEGEALGKMGGDAYVKMRLADQLAKKRIVIVPAANVSTMNVNELVDYLLGKAQSK
jgi:regulator of protease activity HflC (stomatin/prohibitin superfamily)